MNDKGFTPLKDGTPARARRAVARPPASSTEETASVAALLIWESEGGHARNVSTDVEPARGACRTAPGPAVNAASTLVDAERASGGGCMACGHLLTAHDAIAHRYCDATLAHAHIRLCICRSA